MASKIYITFISGSVFEGLLTDEQAASFDYEELPATIIISKNGSKERKTNIAQILEDNSIVDISDIVKGYYVGRANPSDDLWRDLVEAVYGTSGVTDYDTLLLSNDTSTTGTTIYP